jgi:hypothetical protein
MSLLCDQSDGTASHSTRSPNNGDLVAGYAVFRARSLLAYLQGMSRSSLRRALHLDLLMTVPARIIILATALLCLTNIADATESYGMPKLDIGKGGHCVADPQWMRVNHMKVLFQQRDETVHQGIRDGKYSLKNCIECHASLRDNSVIGRADSFCQGCHAYEAVKIDCFECHSSKRSSALAQKEVQ